MPLRSLPPHSPVAAALCALALASPAAAQHAHGEATLEIALDGAVLTLTGESPAMDLVGFEAVPDTPEREAAVADTIEALGADALFVPTAAAGCTAEAAEAEHHVEGDHAAFEIERRWSCAAPEALASIETDWFERFPGTQAIEIEAIGAGGYASQELEAGDGVIDLTAVGG